MAAKKPNGLHVGELVPDPNNAREHGPRNVGLIVDALHEVGAARSIVIDENNVVLAGNATLEAAMEAGLERVRVVDADGEELVAVRRTGLTADQKARLALYDNRAGELSRWSPEVIAALADRDLTRGLFSADELAAIADSAAPDPKAAPDAFAAPDEETDYQCPKCGYAWSGGPR